MASVETQKPHTIPEAVRALRSLLPKSQLDVIKRSTPEDLVRFHFNLGSYIRNLWVHRGGSPLTARIREAGGRVAYGDELSRLIIESLWHDLNGTPFDVRSSADFRRLTESEAGAAKLAHALMVND